MQILLPADQIQARVNELARSIAEEYKDQPLTIVGVLTGCLMFLADLVRRLDLPLRIALIQASSYRGAATVAGELIIDPRLLPDIRCRHVLLLDDILDTGQTLSRLAGTSRSWAPLGLHGCPGAQDRPADGPVRAGLLWFRDPRRLRRGLWTGLQRRLPPSALRGRSARVIRSCQLSVVSKRVPVSSLTTDN